MILLNSWNSFRNMLIIRWILNSLWFYKRWCNGSLYGKSGKQAFSTIWKFGIFYLFPSCANQVNPYILISHRIHEKILVSALHWLAQKKWCGKCSSGNWFNCIMFFFLFAISQRCDWVMCKMNQFDCHMNYMWDVQMLMGHATQVEDKQRRNNKENREEIDGPDYRTDRWTNTYCFVVQWVDAAKFLLFLWESGRVGNLSRSKKKKMISSTVKLDPSEKSWDSPLIRFTDTMCLIAEWSEWWLWAPFHFISENIIMAIYYFIIYYFIAVVLVFILFYCFHTQFQHICTWFN